MAKIDIYTYFTADQTKSLLFTAKSGTRAVLKYLDRNFSKDFVALTEAIADCMPQLIAEDRLYKSGPRQGQRKIVFRDLDRIEEIVSQELTGVSYMRFIRAYDYTKQSMVETVLAPPVSSEQYAKHWIKSFLDDKAAGFPNLKAHYRDQVITTMNRAQKAVDAWLACNSSDIKEVMTWDSNKYNEWHFAQRELAVA